MKEQIDNYINAIILEDCLGKASDERIQLIEKNIGIKLPSTFLVLVRKCDGGTPIKSDFQYYSDGFKRLRWSGIGAFLPLNPDEYGDFLKCWQKPPEFFPEGIVAFADTGGGDFICFDYRKGKDNPDPEIVYWNHDANIGKDISFIAKNFQEFLSLLKEPEDDE